MMNTPLPHMAHNDVVWNRLMMEHNDVEGDSSSVSRDVVVVVQCPGEVYVVSHVWWWR